MVVLEFSQNALNIVQGLIGLVVLFTILENYGENDKITIANIIATLDLINYLRF